MKREQLIKYLDSMYIKIDEDEIKTLLIRAKEVEEILAIFDDYQPKTDVESIYPFALSTSYMREDEVDHLITPEQVLKNAADYQDNYIRYPKVV